MPVNRYKIVLLGEGRVGKTSILWRYIKGEYDERQTSTLQASYLDKSLSINNNNIQLSIWDTAGQERFHALGPIYYRDADGALLVYDITDEASFDKVRNWVRELHRIVGADNINIIIVGNKIDLIRNIKVQEEKAKNYAISVNAQHFYTSAKLNKGLDNVFIELTKLILQRKKVKLSNTGGGILSQPHTKIPGMTSSLILEDNSNIKDRHHHSMSETIGRQTNENRQRGRGQTIQIMEDTNDNKDIHEAIPDTVKLKNSCC